MGNFLLRPKGKKEGPIQAAIVNILKFGWDDLSLKLVYYFFRFFCMAQNVGQGMIKKKTCFSDLHDPTCWAMAWSVASFVRLLSTCGRAGMKILQSDNNDKKSST